MRWLCGSNARENTCELISEIGTIVETSPPPINSETSQESCLELSSREHSASTAHVALAYFEVSDVI